MATAQAEAGQPPLHDGDEPLLEPNPDRFCMFPVHYDTLWKAFKNAETTFWTAEDAMLSTKGAAQQWVQLSPEQQAFVSRTLCFLVASDQLIGVDLAGRFLTDVQVPEARAFYSFQLFKQGVHTEALSALLVAVLGGDEERVAALVREVACMPGARKKVEWVQAWIARNDSFAERLVALAAVEAVFFCTAWCSFYALKRRGLLPTLGFLTDMLSRDEGINVEAAAAVYALLHHKVPQEHLEQIVREVVAIEHEASAELAVEAVGLSTENMHEYQEFVADRLLATFDHPALFGTPNPFEWLEGMALRPPEPKAPAGGSKTVTSGLTAAQVGAMAAAGGPAGGLVFDADF